MQIPLTTSAEAMCPAQAQLLGGIDLGGTKIEAARSLGAGERLVTRRLDTPHGSYEPLLDAISDHVGRLRGQSFAGLQIAMG
ncbi:hypothetical protein GCM10011415_39580 [Salipiger pallidus]|uniref:ROK family protein n=1 Tax=Salipiger pallidus TaxID=1775170 RepID=A0A8J3EII3_9RHOB|nr:hypothetical protein [Salipiger pallidus]GGG85419.1 hypothetical protein GCM10011415_39580 [Salipiger pallidus]